MHNEVWGRRLLSYFWLPLLTPQIEWGSARSKCHAVCRNFTTIGHDSENKFSYQQEAIIIIIIAQVYQSRTVCQELLKTSHKVSHLTFTKAT